MTKEELNANLTNQIDGMVIQAQRLQSILEQPINGTIGELPAWAETIMAELTRLRSKRLGA